MKGLALAKSLFHDQLLSEWVDARRNRYATQLEYVDTISHRYMYVMTALPRQLSAIMHRILCSYSSGIQPKEIARLMFKPQTSISSGLMLLRKAGLVIAKSGNNARERKYFVDDRDFLLVNAIRWDPRFPSFLKANRNRMAEDIVDAFINGL